MEKLPTIDIHGKEYVLVKDRLLKFNEDYKDGSIETEIIKNDEFSVVVKATIRTDKGNKFTGHSEAYRNKGQMGQVPVEVAETSAVGRALAMLGIGIIESVASADEIRKAPQTRQDAPQRTEALNIDPRVPIVSEDDPMGLICACGQPKKRIQTKKPGANQGRWFYSCPKPMNQQCPNSFQWEDEGDFTPDIEGDKTIDYDPETGSLRE